MLRIVETENGLVRGIPAADPRITAFKGIPFAAPPVGANRWRAPQPCKNWDGVLDAYTFAPISVQDTPGLGDNIYTREFHVDPEIAVSEDCLYLNVWTNARSGDEKIPVLVWFFGGGYQWGYTAEMEFDGERIARRGVIVVTVNYRLNTFGFMAHPEITKEAPYAPANFGHFDQRAGILWVRRNIEKFGGDPENITIAGQSAGGGSVLAQITSPLNKGLFKRAIIQSATFRSPYNDNFITPSRSLETAQENGARFFEFLGVKSLDEARTLNAFHILRKYDEFVKNNPRMSTVFDGVFCIGDAISLYMQGKHVGVPVMSGNTGDEFISIIRAGSDAEFKEKARAIFGNDTDKFLAFDEAKIRTKDGGCAPIGGIECTIKSMFLQNEALGDNLNNYYYRFNADVPGWDKPGTFHSVELWFFFETLAKCWRPFDGRHYDLARQMCNYYVNFIRCGDPNGDDQDGTPMPTWKPYTSKTPCSMLFKTDGPSPTCGPEPEFISFSIDKITNDLLKTPSHESNK